MLMGPAGFFEMPDGIIRALRHVHMHQTDADYYGVKAGDIQWPVPKPLPIGPLLNYGYDGTVLLPVPLTITWCSMAFIIDRVWGWITGPKLVAARA